MTASPTDSMDRERGCLPVGSATGSIMNEDVLRTMLAPRQLVTAVDDGRICEPWSVEIARRLLPEGELAEPRLV